MHNYLIKTYSYINLIMLINLIYICIQKYIFLYSSATKIILQGF